MVMCVCTSISPGNPVYFERSIVSAPAGIAAASVVTLRMRSPSTTTMAFVQSFPLDECHRRRGGRPHSQRDDRCTGDSGGRGNDRPLEIHGIARTDRCAHAHDHLYR